VRGFWSEVRNPDRENLAGYREHQHDGVRLFIDETLNTKDTLEVRIASKLPFLRPSFAVKGILTE